MNYSSPPYNNEKLNKTSKKFKIIYYFIFF